jgi:hypothetical protein
MGECIDPKAIAAEDLVAYALDPDDQALAAVKHHVAQCAACAEEVTEMQLLNGRITGRLARFDCPSAETLEAFVAQALAVDEAKQVTTHLAGSSRCVEEVELARAFAAQPEPLLAWKAPSLAAKARRIIATLQANFGANGAPAFALRGRQSDTPLTYQGEDVTLTLRYAKTQQPPRLLGFVDSSTDPDSALEPLPVRLLSAEQIVAETTSEDGAFDIVPVPAGAYILEVVFPDRPIAIEDMELR